MSQENRQLRIDTPLGDDVLLLQSVSGFEKISRLFEYTATVLSKDASIDGNSIVGKQISITYFSEDGRKREICGLVSRFEYSHQVEEPAKLTSYQLTLVPWLWFLCHNRDCQIFQDMTAPDIIKRIFQELNYTDFRIQLSESYAEREYCVQYNETDFDFVSRLMEEEGIFYYFEHKKEKHTLVLCDSTSNYFDVGEEPVNFSPVGQSQFGQLTGWRHIYEFRPGKYSQKDFNFKTPTDPLNTDRKGRVGFERTSDLEIYEYPGLYEEAANGERLAKVRLEELESEHDYIVGSGYYLQFSPGGKFSIGEHSRSSEQGKAFALIEVFTEMNSNLGVGGGGTVDFRNEFRCIPADTVYRPARYTKKPVVDGPQTAIVVTDGQEIVVDEFGRVKVQFHWDRYGEKDINSSCWIRVSQSHAGSGWGMIDIPRQNEEVIVSFLDGDPDRPIITGRVYNGNNSTPFILKGAGNNAKNKTRRGNITKSYEATGFNELSMDDTEGEEQIRFHAQHNMDTYVLNDSKIRVQGSFHQIVGWNKDGDKGGDQNELVWQDKNTNVKRNLVEHVEGNVQLMVGNGDASNGGRLDVVVENQEIHRVGSGGVHLDTSGPKVSLIGGNESCEVGGNYMHKVSGNVAIESGMMNEIHLKAGAKIVLEGGMLGGVCIKGPGGFINIDQTGVTIQGMLVNINSGGASMSGGGCSVESVEPAEEAAPAEPETADRFR